MNPPPESSSIESLLAAIKVLAEQIGEDKAHPVLDAALRDLAAILSGGQVGRRSSAPAPQADLDTVPKWELDRLHKAMIQRLIEAKAEFKLSISDISCESGLTRRAVVNLLEGRKETTRPVLAKLQTFLAELPGASVDVPPKPPAPCGVIEQARSRVESLHADPQSIAASTGLCTKRVAELLESTDAPTETEAARFREWLDKPLDLNGILD